MAKNQMPMMPKMGGGKFKPLAGLFFLAFLVLVLKAPAEAAQITTGAWDAVGGAVENFMAFTNQLEL